MVEDNEVEEGIVSLGNWDRGIETRFRSEGIDKINRERQSLESRLLVSRTLGQPLKSVRLMNWVAHYDLMTQRRKRTESNDKCELINRVV